LKKRTVALVFLLLVATLVVASLAVLRTPWAGERICALATARVEAATGLPLSFRSCRINPLGLEVEAEGVSLGPPAAPAFTAEVLSARLSAVQALGRQLHLERLRLVRPQVRAELPAASGTPGTCPPAFLSRFEIRQLDVIEGALDLGLPGGGRVAVGRFDIRSRPPIRTLRSLAAPTRRARLDVETGPVRLDLAGRSFSAASLSAAGEVALDLSSAEISSVRAEVGGARLGVEGRIEDLCAPHLGLTVRAEGPVSALLGLAGIDSTAEGTAAVEARVSGTLRAPAVSASARTRGLRIDQFVPGDVDAQLRLAGNTLSVERLAVTADGAETVAHGTVRLARGVPVEAEVDLGGVDLGEVLDRLGVTGPWVSLRLDGKAKVSGTLSPPQLSGTLALGLRRFRALTRSYRDAAGDPGVLAFEEGRFESAVTVDRNGLYFSRSRLSVGRGTLEADAAVHFNTAGGFWARCRGDVDLTELRRVAAIPWAGRATVEASVAAAPYANPRITGRARVEGFHFLQVDLGNVAADLAYGPDFVLRVEGAEGLRNATRYHGEAAVDLGQTPPRVLSSRLDAHGRLRDLFDSVLEWLPRTRYLRDAMDGDVALTGAAAGRADALDVDFDAHLGAGTLLGRGFDSGRAAGKILGARMTRFEQAELRRGSGSVKAQGTWGVEGPFPWDLEVAFAGVPLADLAFPGGAWTGTASGTATLGGSWEHPKVRFAANGVGVGVGGVAVGTVQAGGSIVERKLALTGSAEGMDLAAEARLEGRLPFTARATLALDDASRLLPGGPPAGLKVRVHGEATAEGDLEDLGQARAELRVPQLQATYADLKLDATGPAQVAFRGGRFELAPVTLKGASTELTLAGSAVPGGALDVVASGALDLRLLGGVVPALRKAHGQLALEAHVGGTADEPLLVGAGRIVDGGFQLRGVTVSAAGGPLAFSQNRILFDALTANVNGGQAKFRGEVELARFVPARLRVESELDEVPVAIPAYLPVTISGRVEAEGTPDATNVTGRVHVVRARYTADVDLEGSLFELRRRPPPAPKAYDRADEWLRLEVQLTVDGDARVENDLVRGSLSGELTLTGSLAAPGLVGSLAMGEGSRAIFRGNEFILTHAVLEFADRHKIEIALDVHGESQVRDYQVLMHVFGSLARPELTLTSLPSLSQPDIITLLSLGYTRRDTAAGAGVSGVATAAAAQALFSASGLDEQVKRFLPRGGPIRDLSMRITSAYSEQSGQVEPRAEFESWIVPDRLRLRFQAPLGGARGRKAEAELRLGKHTALQYQWEDDNPEVATGDHGVDLKLRWEWSD
jgi:translocation and assembly module TamB